MMTVLLVLSRRLGAGDGGPVRARPRGRNNGNLGGRTHYPPLRGGSAVENEPRKVRFLITDLIHPHPARVLLELFRDHELEGAVEARTNDGEAPFLVVRVPGLKEAVIVPLDRTRPAEAAACAPITRH
jgi:hypothetical protein